MIIVKAAFESEIGETEIGVDPGGVKNSLQVVLQAIKEGSLSLKELGWLNLAIEQESVKSRREGEDLWSLSPQGVSQVPQSTAPGTFISEENLGIRAYEDVKQELEVMREQKKRMMEKRRKKSSRNVFVRIAGFA